MCKVVQLTGYMAALAKNCNHLRGLRNVDNKIVQFSWWKSGCEQECRFPIDQELYRPSGVAHLDANKSTSSTTTQVAAATYLDNQNELNIPSNLGDGIRCQIFDDGDCFVSTTVEAESLGTNSGLIGTVLGHAAAWSSWGKSGCEQKCHFQINGGLHCSSGEAPLDTESLQILIWCHVNKSESPSSTRTQVAAVAYLDKQNEFSVHSMKHHRTKHNRYLNADQRKTKLDENIKDISVWKVASSKRLMSENITNNRCYM
jgi:hypothetical protein